MEFAAYVQVAVGVLTCFAAIVGALNWLLSNRETNILAKIEVARTADKLELKTQSASDKAEIVKALTDHHANFVKLLADQKESEREWINGSFFRSAVVNEKFESICERLDRIEDHVTARK